MPAHGDSVAREFRATVDDARIKPRLDRTHGGDIDASARSVGGEPKEIIDFSASINPLGPPPSARKAFINSYGEISRYPDPYGEMLKEALAKRHGMKTVEVLVGNRRLLNDAAIDTTQLEALRGGATDDQTLVYVAVNRKAAGLILIGDPVKPTAAPAIAELKRMGLDVVLVTGDEERTARAIAQRAGIDEVFAGVLPAGKVEAIRQRQGAGAVVAMVGDGINDAPALAQADVGMAIGSGTDVAIEAADLTLMRNDLSAIPQSIALARRSMRVMKQNLFWAFIYNIIGIPVAAGLLYPFTGLLLSPILASAAMALSSVSVVSNSLRLRGYTPQLGR